MLPLGVHTSSSTNANFSSTASSMPRENIRQVVLIHNILLLLPSLLVTRTRKFLLVLSQDEIRSPVVLTARVLGETAV